MTIHAWRITKAKHAATALSGSGAKAFGGRWNSPGTAIIYTAGSTSLAVLEMLVHLQNVELMQRYVLFKVSFDESLIEAVALSTLPKTWRKSPSQRAVQKIGDDWVHGAKVGRLASAQRHRAQ